MSNPIVFYSWQSDLDRSSTRELIRDATEQAIKNAQAGLPLEDSPRLDHDTEGRAGTPSITETIYHKIDRSAVFIADVTFIGERPAEGGKTTKKLSNPNVLIELGYAAAKLGWERIVLVINKHYGSPESLPFDLRNRRFPATFDLGPKSTRRSEVLNALASRLELAITTCLASDYQRVDDILAKISSYGRALIQKHAAHTHFWEESSDNKIMTRLDYAVYQLLELEVAKCVDFPSELSIAIDRGDAYEWTYLGKQCIARLGFGLLPNPVLSGVEQSPVSTSLFTYDDLIRDDGSRYRIDVVERGMPDRHFPSEKVATDESKNTDQMRPS